MQSVTGAIKTSNALCSVSGNVNVHKRKHIDLSLKHRIEVGDHVISEWKRKGRYFSAKVKKILPNSKYLVAWNDGDAEQGKSYLFYLRNIWWPWMTEKSTKLEIDTSSL